MGGFEVAFFVVHCLLHCFAYWLPCAVRALLGLLVCRPCRECDRRRHGYTYHPPREVLVVHNTHVVETAVDVFGLMDVAAATLGDRQYCYGADVDAAKSFPAAATAAAAAAQSHAPDAEEPQSQSSDSQQELQQHCRPTPPAQGHALDAGVSAPSSSWWWWERGRANGVAAAESSSVSAEDPRADRHTMKTYNSQRDPRARVNRDVGDTNDAPSSPPSPLQDGGTLPARARQISGAPTYAASACKALNVPTFHKPNTTARRAIKRCRLEYNAPLYGPHVETIMGSMRPSDRVPYTREEMLAWDGCYIAMDWWYVEGEEPRHYDHEHTSRIRSAASVGDGGNERQTSSDAHEPREMAQQPPDPSDTAVEVPPPLAANTTTTAPAPAASSSSAAAQARGVLFILPGLSSYSQTKYVRHFVRAMHGAGFHVCVLSTRGMGDTPPLTTRFLFNGAYTRDTRDCLQRFFTKTALTRRFGHPVPVIGVGLSVGGVTLSKYLGEAGIAGADPLLDAGVCCCSPIDFVYTTEHMNRHYPQRLVYQPDMCNDIRNYIMRHPPLQHMPNVDHDWVFAQGNIHRFHRVLHFDEHVIAKSAGYRSAHHYHVDASAMTWLPYVPVPVLVVSAADDPVIGRTVMPHRWRELVRDNPRVVYAEAPVGGHLGFLGSPWAELRRADNWLEAFVHARAAAACAYWYRVQAQDPGGCSAPSHTAQAAAAASDSPPMYSPVADCPATGLDMPAAAAAPPGPLCLMRKLALTGSRGDDRVVSNEAQDVTAPADVAQDVPYAPLAFVSEASVYRDPHERGEATTAVSTAAGGSSSSAPLGASPQPIQYMPPREDRSTNACYFSYYCTPAAPPAQLGQPYFTVSAEAGVEMEQTDRSSSIASQLNAGDAMTTVATKERALRRHYATRTSMYSTDRSSSRNRTSLSANDDLLRGADTDGGLGATSASTATANLGDERGGGAAGRDPRCMMMTGQHTYAPVVVNCDYLVDPRTLMQTD